MSRKSKRSPSRKTRKSSKRGGKRILGGRGLMLHGD
jgi:hypothetical protein